MYDHYMYMADLRKIIAIGRRESMIKPWFRKERLENLDILFMVDEHGARSYDTDCLWMYRHVEANQEIKKDLLEWIATGNLPAWANKVGK